LAPLTVTLSSLAYRTKLVYETTYPVTSVNKIGFQETIILFGDSTSTLTLLTPKRVSKYNMLTSYYKAFLINMPYLEFNLAYSNDFEFYQLIVGALAALTFLRTMMAPSSN